MEVQRSRDWTSSHTGNETGVWTGDWTSDWTEDWTLRPVVFQIQTGRLLCHL
jgi:hypothetical protein